METNKSSRYFDCFINEYGRFYNGKEEVTGELFDLKRTNAALFTNVLRLRGEHQIVMRMSKPRAFDVQSLASAQLIAEGQVKDRAHIIAAIREHKLMKS